MDLPLLYFTIGQRYYTVWIYHVFFNRYPIVVCYVAARHNLVQMPFCICKDTSSRQIYRAGPAGSRVNGVSLVDCQQPPMRVYHSELPSAKGSYLFPQSSPIVCAIQLFEFLLLWQVKMYVSVVWICMSFIVSEFEYFFICLKSICRAFSETCLVKCFAYFSLLKSFFHSIFKSALYRVGD